jgi:hypothetical protein
LNLLEATAEALWKRIISDHKCQLAAIEGMKMAMGDNFLDPREYKGISGEKGKFVTKKTESQQNVPKTFWTIPFLLYAYDVKRSNFKNKKNADKNGVTNLTEGIKKRIQLNKGDCVITNRVASRRHYNARYFFSRMKALAGTIPVFKDDAMNYPNAAETCYTRPEWRHYKQRVAWWNDVYDAIIVDQCSLDINEDMSQYDKMATVHDARQPFIQDELVEAIKSYNCVTYRQLAGHINHWCEHSCIMNWLHSHESYSLYAKNIKPGLTPENQPKQVAFSRRVQQRWGLEPGTKILWMRQKVVPRDRSKDERKSLLGVRHSQDFA